MEKHAPIRRGKFAPPEYWKSIRSRIDCSAAVTTINKTLQGEKIGHQQFQASIFILNKFLPNLSAIAVQVETNVSRDKTDLVAKALEHGINPIEVFGGLDGAPVTTKPKTNGKVAPKKKNGTALISDGPDEVAGDEYDNGATNEG